MKHNFLSITLNSREKNPPTFSSAELTLNLLDIKKRVLICLQKNLKH